MNTRFSKSILILAIVSMLSAGSVFAGNGNGDGSGKGHGKAGGKGGANTEWNGGPAQKMSRMSEMLGLTEQQELDLLAFFHEQEANREAMRIRIQEAFGEEICAQRAANEGAFETLLYTVLSEEQIVIHEEMKAQREGRKGNKRRGGRGNGGFECPAPAID